ncbi:hypothetical protein PVK06_008331 [Gossypium arboreum]|uniref:Uncharacterized protein n=1 Tax=Gossypium arboreum TaxID=29729 RepID=A0ABR0QJP7_GOSAR|nr:hypothetical protein PVK06_008331 [Gossypium arboreum]
MTTRPINNAHTRRGPINSAHIRHRPINGAHTITGPNTSTDDTHITSFSDYANPMVG